MAWDIGADELARRVYLELPGTSGNYASTPDSAALSITGDIDITLDLSIDDLTPAATQYLMAKAEASGNRSWDIQLLSTGLLKLRPCEDGTNVIDGTTEQSDVALQTVVANGERFTLRITLDVDNGASGRDLKFYVNGVQLGTTQVGSAPVALFDGNESVKIGRSTNAPLAGKVYRAQIRDGIGGTLVFDADFTAESPGTTSFTESSSEAATVTVNQSGDPFARIWTDALELKRTVGLDARIEFEDLYKRYVALDAALAPLGKTRTASLDAQVIGGGGGSGAWDIGADELEGAGFKQCGLDARIVDLSSSQTVTASAGAAIAPQTPSGLTVVATGVSWVSLSWTDNSGGTAQHRVYYRKIGDSIYSDWGWLWLGDTTDTVRYLDPGQTYVFAVAAISADLVEGPFITVTQATDGGSEVTTGLDAKVRGTLTLSCQVGAFLAFPSTGPGPKYVSGRYV